MSDTQTSGGAANANAGGNGDNQQQGSGSTDQQSQVNWDDHQRALKDMLRFKDQSKAEAAKVAALQAQIEELSTKMSAQNKDYETLYSTEKQKRADIEAEKNKLLGNVLNSERYRAAYPALKKAGLRDDADNLVELMGLDKIDVEATSSGRFVCSNVQDFVDGAVKQYPYAFQKANVPNVNSGSGNGQQQCEKWTAAKLVALETECKKKGDMAPFKAAFEVWKSQGKPI